VEDGADEETALVDFAWEEVCTVVDDDADVLPEERVDTVAEVTCFVVDFVVVVPKTVLDFAALVLTPIVVDGSVTITRLEATVVAPAGTFAYTTELAGAATRLATYEYRVQTPEVDT